MQFAQEHYLWSIWISLGLGLSFVLAVWRRRALARRFLGTTLLPRLDRGAGAGRLVLRALLGAAGLALVGVGLARPQWGEVERNTSLKGRDVVFLIDVSRSMLAEDLKPNRLERAKLWVNDTLDVVRGDRVGLVAFAGTAVVKAPLTHDMGFVRFQLDRLSPSSVNLGGSLVGDAVRVAIERLFDGDEARFRDIVLITDGEDHGSFPIEAAAAAREAGVRLIIVGIGDENMGTPIAISDRRGRQQFLEHEGERVLSKLDGETLRAMALASDEGAYFNVSTGTIELDKVYTQLIAQAEQRETESLERVRLEDRFQWFLGAGILLLLIESLIGDGRRRARA
ncbi:MAG: VWA domain-containing protein [Planctomycetota bacterium]